MSEDRSTSGQKSWLEKLTQAFVHEPKTRQDLLDILREAHQNKLLDNEALAIVEGAIQVADCLAACLQSSAAVSLLALPAARAYTR